jgi:hypothetical protein
MDLATIQRLTDEYEALTEEIHQWYLAEVHPRIVACKNIEELHNIWAEVSRAYAGPDGTVRKLPGLLHVEKVISYDAFRESRCMRI